MTPGSSGRRVGARRAGSIRAQTAERPIIPSRVIAVAAACRIRMAEDSSIQRPGSSDDSGGSIPWTGTPSGSRVGRRGASGRLAPAAHGLDPGDMPAVGAALEAIDLALVPIGIDGLDGDPDGVRAVGLGVHRGHGLPAVPRRRASAKAVRPVSSPRARSASGAARHRRRGSAATAGAGVVEELPEAGSRAVPDGSVAAARPTRPATTDGGRRSRGPGPEGRTSGCPR